MRIHVSVLILFTIIFVSLANKLTLAVDVPNFPNCSNPQDRVKIQYNNGTHGIVGDSTQYTGKDTVYQLDNSNLMQCFCASNGAGIQTNWWKVSSLDPEQLQILKNAGWIYVPNGALWGLEETAYMTFNSPFSCTTTSNGNGGSSSGSGGSGDGRSDGLGCGSHDCSNQGQILSALKNVGVGDILGLASTGGSWLPFFIASAGFTTLIFGIILNYRSAKK